MFGRKWRRKAASEKRKEGAKSRGWRIKIIDSFSCNGTEKCGSGSDHTDLLQYRHESQRPHKLSKPHPRLSPLLHPLAIPRVQGCPLSPRQSLLFNPPPSYSPISSIGRLTVCFVLTPPFHRRVHHPLPTVTDNVLQGAQASYSLECLEVHSLPC